MCFTSLTPRSALGRTQGVEFASFVIYGVLTVASLNLAGYDLPWEERSFEYPGNFALPLEVLIEASNGASDYGNKFGEPLISGFVRSFGIVDSSGERREWIKPIMFSGGVGAMNADMVDKEKPQKGAFLLLSD